MSIWKRSDSEEITTTSVISTTNHTPTLNQAVQTDTRVKAIIGPEICVKGTISGAEDLMVLGSVEGTIELGKNVVTIGRSGVVKANISGKTIHIEGEVEGDLVGAEQVIVHRAGQVIGNISAPRVALEDGARVKGTIDTDSQGTENTLATNIVSERAQTRNTTTANALDPSRTTVAAKTEARVN